MPFVSPLSNRRVDLAPEAGGVISAVAPGSLAHELGIKTGDQIISINQSLILPPVRAARQPVSAAVVTRDW